MRRSRALHLLPTLPPKRRAEQFPLPADEVADGDQVECSEQVDDDHDRLLRGIR